MQVSSTKLKPKNIHDMYIYRGLQMEQGNLVSVMMHGEPNEKHWALSNLFAIAKVKPQMLRDWVTPRLHSRISI